MVDRTVVEGEAAAVLERHRGRRRRPSDIGDGSGLLGRGRAVRPVIGGCVRRREGLRLGLVVTLLVRLHVVPERHPEIVLRVGQFDPVLRALRAGDGRDDGAEVELQVFGVHRLALVVVPQPLLLRVTLDECDLGLVATREAQVVQRGVVDREHRDRRAVLRAHVADRRAVGQRHRADPGSVELDELAHRAVFAQHLRDREHQVGGGGALGQRAAELEAHDPRDQHADRLAEHRRLCLDAPDAPADDAEPVHHRRVRVGSDARIGVRLQHAADLPVVDDLGEMLDVHLVHDSGARRDDLEVVERRLTPPQELVTLAVAAVLDLDVAGEGVRRAEDIGDDAVVDDEFGRGERVDLVRIAAEVGHRLTHRREVDDRGHAGEVLHDHPGGRELDLLAGLSVRIPLGEATDVVGGDVRAVLGAEEVLQQHLQAVGQPIGAGHGVESEDLVGLLPDGQVRTRGETVGMGRTGHGHDSSLGCSTQTARPARRRTSQVTLTSSLASAGRLGRHASTVPGVPARRGQLS